VKRTAHLLRPPRTGFTLVELLVALCLAVVVTVLILATLASVNSARRGQAERAACLDTANRLLHHVADDLERAFVFTPDKKTSFNLVRGAAASNAVLELTFARVAPLRGEDDARWAEADHMSYRLVEADPSNLTLYCLSQPLVGPGALQPATTNQLFQGLENFDILLFDGREWKDTWVVENSNATNAVPRAARLALTARRGAARQLMTADVIIPIGMKFEAPKKAKGKKISEIQ